MQKIMITLEHIFSTLLLLQNITLAEGQASKYQNGKIQGFLNLL